MKEKIISTVIRVDLSHVFGAFQEVLCCWECGQVTRDCVFGEWGGVGVGGPGEALPLFHISEMRWPLSGNCSLFLSVGLAAVGEFLEGGGSWKETTSGLLFP